MGKEALHTDNNKNHSKKTPVHSVWVIYYWTQSLPLRVACPASWTQLKRTNFSLASSLSTTDSFWIRDGVLYLLPSLRWDPNWHRPMDAASLRVHTCTPLASLRSKPLRFSATQAVWSTDSHQRAGYSHRVWVSIAAVYLVGRSLL